MDRKTQKMRPNYNIIYLDLINKKFPDKINKHKVLLNKKELSTVDIIKLNEELFGQENATKEKINQSLRSYDMDTILEILAYQKKNNLNNTEVANHFKVSRNTITKWKNIYN